MLIKKIRYPVPKNIKLLRKISKIKKKITDYEIAINSEGDVFHKNSLGVDFFIDINNHFHHHVAGEQKEFKTIINLIKENLSKNSTIVDVGANIGLYSLSIAKVLSDSLIYAFEPVKSTYNILNKNIKRNKLQQRVKANKNAVGEKECKIVITNTYDTGNFIQSEENEKSNKSEEVEMITIDNFCQNNNIEKIDFLKCDVEGYEKYVIKGSYRIINNCRPIILLELSEEMTNRYDYSPLNIIDLLKDNYNIYYINNCDGVINKYNYESSCLLDILKVSNNFLFLGKNKGFRFT